MGEQTSKWETWSRILRSTLEGGPTPRKLERVSEMLRKIDAERWEVDVRPVVEGALATLSSPDGAEADDTDAGADRGPGRPPKPPEERKDQRVAFRLRAELADALSSASRPGESVHQAARRIVEESLDASRDPVRARLRAISSWVGDALRGDEADAWRPVLERLASGASRASATHGAPGELPGALGFEGDRLRTDHADAVWLALQAGGGAP